MGKKCCVIDVPIALLESDSQDSEEIKLLAKRQISEVGIYFCLKS